MDGLLGDAFVAASLSVRLLLDLTPDLLEVQELLVAGVQEFSPLAISEVECRSHFHETKLSVNSSEV